VPAFLEETRRRVNGHSEEPAALDTPAGPLRGLKIVGGLVPDAKMNSGEATTEIYVGLHGEDLVAGIDAYWANATEHERTARECRAALQSLRPAK
jgi:hypothetical protein